MAHIGLPSLCVTGTCHREVKESLQRQCQRPPFHQRSGSLSYFRSAIVLVLSAKNVYLRPATNHHLQGWFFKFVIVLSRFLTLSPSPIIFLLRQFDRFQERLCFSQRVLEAVAADVSDNHPQPKATAVPWLHLLVISRNAYPNASTNLPRKGTHFATIPSDDSSLLLKKIKHFGAFLRKHAVDFHRFRN